MGPRVLRLGTVTGGIPHSPCLGKFEWQHKVVLDLLNFLAAVGAECDQTQQSEEEMFPREKIKRKNRQLQGQKRENQSKFSEPECTTKWVYIDLEQLTALSLLTLLLSWQENNPKKDALCLKRPSSFRVAGDCFEVLKHEN